MGGTAKLDNSMNVGLVNLGVAGDLLGWIKGASEKVLAQFLQTARASEV